MNFRKGFALPTVLISSLIMLTVLLVSISSTSAVRISLASQYYDDLTKYAAESGITYAQYCLSQSFGVALWSNEKPLSPSTDCSGNQLAGINCTISEEACYVVSNGNIRTSFRVGLSESVAVSGWKKIAPGNSHTCAISSDDKVYCWGSNTMGQLGNGLTTDSYVPFAVDTGGLLKNKVVTDIASGDYHTCVISSDNRAYCWGNNGAGQLGNSSTINSRVPVAVSGSLSDVEISSISAGSYHTCATTLADNKAYCWGENDKGQLGTNSFSDTVTPAAVYTGGALSGRIIKKIVTGQTHTCALSDETLDDLVFCWGDGSAGRLGNGSYSDSDEPVAVTMSSVSVTGLSTNKASTCVTADDNNAYCWGSNIYGQLGNGTTTSSNLPVQVIKTGTLLDGLNISYIEAGGSHTCVIASDSNVYCWGRNNYGQLGNGDLSNSTTPVLVTTADTPMSGKTAINISASDLNSCVVASDDNAYCWGYNNNGQLGDVSTDNRNKPIIVNIVNVLVKNINSRATTDLLKKSGGVWRKYEQRLMIDLSKLVDNLEYVSSSTKSIVEAGGYHTCSIGNDEIPYCWGSATRSQLGNMSNTQRTSAVVVYMDGELKGKTIKSISTNTYHTCVIASDNRVYCWGVNSQGRLGIDSYEDKNYPTAVNTIGTDMDGKDINYISAGAYHTCAIDTVGDAYCWGWNEDGQIGDGTIGITDKLKPAKVYRSGAINGKALMTISTGYKHTCAATTDGFAFCWGRNGWGQVGDGTTISTGKEWPTAVIGLSGKTVTDISAGRWYSCAVASSDAYCWGRNDNGQLGIGSSDSSAHSTPLAVDKSSSSGLYNKTVKSISASSGSNAEDDSGGLHVCAIASDDRPYCWGDNSAGQLGNDSTTDSFYPTAIVSWGDLGARTVKYISSGYKHTCVVALNNKVYCWGNNGNGQLGNRSTADIGVSVTSLKITNYITNRLY